MRTEYATNYRPLSMESLVSLLLLGMLLLLSGKVYAQTTTTDLFSSPQVAAEEIPNDTSIITRSRLANINLGLLTTPPDKYNTLINMNFFSDRVLPAVHDRTEKTPNGIAWIGHLQGIPLSQVIIVVNGEVASGNIYSPDSRFHIRFVSKGTYSIQEVDTTQFPEEEPISHPYPGFPKQTSIQTTGKGADTPTDDGSTIDVMVAYTTAAKNAVGGTTAMQSLIELGIVETNTAYGNSDVLQRLNLVHTEEVAYTETGNIETDLNCITDTTDSCLDDIHTLRDEYHADLVSFWVANAGNYCGVAWLLDYDWLDQLGFSVVDKDCATGYYSFGHELGHNMGLAHDVYVDSNPLFAYGHGYTYPAGKWRTIMAYNNACAAQGVNCTRINYFSSPYKQYKGVTVGNPTKADNHRVLNETAYTIANYRQSGAIDTIPHPFSFTDQTGVALSSMVVSNAITVTGINAPADISISGGEYSINGGDYTASSTTVSTGDSVQVRHTSSASYSTATNTTLTIGGVSDTFTSTTLAAPAPVTLTVGKTGTGTVSSTPSGINCGTDCTENYAQGSTVTLTASPAAGYIFSGWSDACSGTDPVCTLNMDGSKKAVAKFIAAYTLTVTKSDNGTITSTPVGISCGSDCAEDYKTGTSVTLTATADAGNKFTGWSGGCKGTTTICTLNMKAAKTVTANFKPVYTLDISKTGNGLGKVTGTGINCDTRTTPDCKEDYLAGSSVKLTATPTTGHKFTGWTGCISTTNTCTVTMSEAKAVTANFDYITFKLTSNKTGNGTISSSPEGINCGADCSTANYAYRTGTSVILTATADAGNKFTGWSGSCTGTATTCTLSMKATKTVTANFKPVYTLDVSKTGHGSGKITGIGINCDTSATPDCQEDYLTGTTVKLTATPDTSHKFTGWTGCTSTTNTCTVTMSASTTVTANFDLAASVVERVAIDNTFNIGGHPSPYVITSQNQGANLYLLGSQHASTATSPTYKTVKQIIDTTPLTGIILEGVPNSVSIDKAFGSLPCISNPSQCTSEMHYAYALGKAKKTGIVFKGGEAGSLVEYQHMTTNTAYTAEDYFAFLYTRDAVSLNSSNQMSEDNLRTQIARHRTSLQQELGITITFNYDAWIEWYKSKMQVASVDLTSITSDLLNPNVDTTIINQISREMNVIRDTNLVATIKGLLAADKNILVVYGSGHIGTIYPEFTNSSTITSYLTRWF